MHVMRFFFFSPVAKCYNVAKENRIDCGDESNEACVAKGCCYDSDVGSGVPHCYHDANHIGKINCKTTGILFSDHNQLIHL